MTENMKTLDKATALTETGRLKENVRKVIYSQAVTYLLNAGFKMNENGRMSMNVATVDGKVVSVNLDVKIGLDTDFSAKKTEKTAKATEKVDIGNLF